MMSASNRPENNKSSLKGAKKYMFIKMSIIFFSEIIDEKLVAIFLSFVFKDIK